MKAFVDHVEVVLPEGKRYVIVLANAGDTHVLVTSYLSPLVIAQFLTAHLSFERLRLPRAHPYYGPGATHDVRSLLEHADIEALYGERDGATQAVLDALEQALSGSADAHDLGQRLEHWRTQDRE